MLIGTPKALHLFSAEFRQARRATGDGNILWDRLPCDECWDDFIQELWKYQWLQSPKPLDEPMTLKLYELSQGVPDIVVKLFCVAQSRSILLARKPADEYLSIELLDDVFEDEFSIVKPMLEALKTKDKHMLEKCNDLVIPRIESTLLNAFDYLKPTSLSKKKNIELGNEKETDLAKAALEALTAMGVSSDIAEPLLKEAIQSNPDITLIQIIHLVTKALGGASRSSSITKPKKQKNITVKSDTWGQLTDGDLRKIFSDKTTSMYESLEKKELIYPINELLAG